MSNVTLKDLKSSLSECHLTANDKKVKLLLDVKDPNYYLHRVMECIANCQDKGDVQEETKLAIQLLNIYRVATRGPIQTDRKPTDGTGGENPG